MITWGIKTIYHWTWKWIKWAQCFIRLINKWTSIGNRKAITHLRTCYFSSLMPFKTNWLVWVETSQIKSFFLNMDLMDLIFILFFNFYQWPLSNRRWLKNNFKIHHLTKKFNSLRNTIDEYISNVNSFFQNNQLFANRLSKWTRWFFYFRKMRKEEYITLETTLNNKYMYIYKRLFCACVHSVKSTWTVWTSKTGFILPTKIINEQFSVQAIRWYIYTFKTMCKKHLKLCIWMYAVTYMQNKLIICLGV